MANVIKKLTEEQKGWIPGVVNKWVSYALNLPEKNDAGMFLWEPAPPITNLQNSMVWLYKEANLPSPKTIELDSPFAMQLSANLLLKLPWKEIAKRVTNEPLDAQGEPAEWAVRNVPILANRLVANGVLRKVDLKQYLTEALGKDLPKAITSVIDKMSLEYVPTACIGVGHDAGWAAYYDYYLMVGGDPIPNNEKRFELVKSGIWDCIVLQDVALVCRRPFKVRLDNQNRLHSLDAEALGWNDGYKLYFVANVNMPERYYTEPETLTSKEVIDQDNVEVRKGMIQLMGVGRFITEAGGVILNEDFDGAGMPRKLFQLKTEDARGNKFTVIEVECPSKHDKHYLFVPPTMKTCKEAIEWTFDVEGVYQPVLET